MPKRLPPNVLPRHPHSLSCDDALWDEFQTACTEMGFRYASENLVEFMKHFVKKYKEKIKNENE